MVDIKHNVTINADPSLVYEALTEQKHIALWWTKDNILEPKAGSIGKFEFKEFNDWADILVEKLEPNKLVQWKVTGGKMMQTDDWRGTTIIFKLSNNEKGGTDINFMHEDFKSETECYKKCVEGWHHFIVVSLKSYLETGKGVPFSGKME
jgi:uncharacterized protein YndB with AHSA1/START domain